MPTRASWLAFAFLLAVGCDKPPTGGETPSPTDSGDPPVVAEPEPGPGDQPPQPAPSAPSDGETSGALPGTLELVVGTDPCKTDADCVKQECCHATSCGAADKAPDCSQVMCTMDCQGGTMDCGGGCLCHEGKCAAQLFSLVEPTQ